MSRDRDPTGRARNARPRDAYGRPLPHGAAGVDRVPEDVVLAPREALSEAQRLLEADRPFHAHEVLEGAWRAAAEPERELWQGLAQLAVGITHVRRGNLPGAAALLRRGAGRVAPYAGSRPYGVPAGELARWAQHGAALLDSGQAELPAPPELTGG